MELDNRQYLLDVLRVEVKSQCELAIVAKVQLDTAVDAGRHIDTWLALQGILIAAANLSKLFWGGGGERASNREERKEIRSQLRARLGVTAPSALRDRKMRDDLEHFHDRIFDLWFESNETPTQIVFRDVVNEAGGIAGPGFPGPYFGRYDPATETVTFLDRELDLGAVLRAVFEVAEKVNLYVAHPDSD